MHVKWNHTTFSWVFCVSFLASLLSIMVFRFIHVLAYFWSLFIFTAEWYSIAWIEHNLFICSHKNTWIICIFWLLQIKLLWTSEYRSLKRHLLFTWVNTCDCSWETAKLFSKVENNFAFPQPLSQIGRKMRTGRTTELASNPQKGHIRCQTKKKSNLYS